MELREIEKKTSKETIALEYQTVERKPAGSGSYATD